MQTKKPAIRDAILRAAARHFRARGYGSTSLALIARGAGISTSNIYVYFASKLDILFALAGPWLQARMTALEAEVRALPTPRDKLLRLFIGLWADLPGDPKGYATLLMEGLATLGPQDGYSRDLLRQLEARAAALMVESLPPGRQAIGARAPVLAHLAFMAFDGFAVNQRLASGPDRVVDAAEALCDLLLGDVASPGARR